MQVDRLRVEYDRKRGQIVLAMAADSNFRMDAGDEMLVFMDEQRANAVLAQILEALARSRE